MPRVTISINAPGEQVEQDLLTLDLPPTFTLADLKALVQGDTNLPANLQQYYYNGLPLRDDAQSLEALGLKDGEMLAMTVNRRGAGQASGAQRTPAQAQRATGNNPQSDEEHVERTRQHIARDPASVMQLRQAQPQLADAINDPQRFFAIWRELKIRERQEQAQRENEIAMLNDDPFNADAQQRIAEIIRRERIEENRQYAYENNPEVFVQVTMLYVNVRVNGVPIKAFVDSGAQSTIMSPTCAERCNIHHLIDERYAGIARGVGTAKILGRVHNSKIEIGDAELDCSFTVMEGRDVDLLFGLDMLRRHQACIDLTTNELRFPHTTVKFLGESDVPKKHEESMMDEPVVQGPDGTEIGAISGTVRPAGSAAAAHDQGGQAASNVPSAAAASTSKQPATSAPAPAAVRSPYPTASRTVPLSSSTPAAAPPQQPPNAGPATTRPAGRTFPEQDINQIMSIGFTREEAIGALQACNGNVEFAASMLFGNM